MQLVKHLFIWPLLDAKEPGKCSFISGNQASWKKSSYLLALVYSSNLIMVHNFLIFIILGIFFAW